MNQFREITGRALAYPESGFGSGPEGFITRTPPGLAGDMYESDWEAPLAPRADIAAAKAAQTDRSTIMPRTISDDPEPFDPLPTAIEATRNPRRVPIVVLGTSLGIVLSTTFVLCVLFDLWFPTYSMNAAWAVLLPGFTWITWPSFFLGLAETFAYGWYFALLFGGVYNFMLSRAGDRTAA
jgi:2TM family of unknown function (DUF5676)